MTKPIIDQAQRSSIHRLRAPGILLALMVVPVTCLDAQSAPTATSKFEVVSVKPSTGCGNSGGKTGRGGGGGRANWDPGRLSLECQTVENLIRWAYLRFPNGVPWPVSATIGLPDSPISQRLLNQEFKGSPAWFSSDRYDIDAKPSGPQSMEMMRGPMIQVLLEDRFKLKIHRETREIPVYELTVAKGGPKLLAWKPGSCLPFDLTDGPPPPLKPGQPPPAAPCGAVHRLSNDQLEIRGVTMADLCRQFSVSSDRDVIDKTGITGVFDFHLELSFSDLGYPEPGSGPAPFTPTDGVAISIAVQKFGLQLKPAKGSGEFIVIDHVEKPSGN